MAGTLIVSLDFELFWGMLDVCPLEAYQDHVMGGRKAIPEILELFQKYGIHATWAAVGFQFGENIGEVRDCFPVPEQRPTYDNHKLDPYGLFDRIGDHEGDAPCFLAPSLIHRISGIPGQEIGSHTFSHYYCREKGQTVEQFEADLNAAQAIAQKKGYTLRSLVLPRNQCEPEYTRVLSACGFTAFRDEESDWIHERIRFRPLLRALRLLDVYLPLTGQGGYRPQKEDGVWNLTGSRMLKPIFRPLILLERLKLRRIKAQMLHAAKNDLTFHLWWHPHNMGVHTQDHLGQLEELLRYYTVLRDRYGMHSRNMAEAVRALEEEEYYR